ncbi:hypothetical protein OZX65_03935 [Leuconostocaceae bacterium ESL0723]|nr:hypothetical protein OZX65_03935 [Leuconostocaceae bacterium ESL0723]
MKTGEVIEKSSELLEQLTPENEKFYSDFMDYVRSQNFDRDENQMESALLDILQDTIDAQSDGISAADYFGKNPKELGDEILRNLPRNFKYISKLMLVGASSFIFFSFFPSIIDPKASFDWGTALIVAGYTTIFYITGYKLMGKTIYNTWFKEANKKIKNGIMFGLFTIFIVIGVVLLQVVKTPFKFTLPGWSGIIAILLLDLIALTVYMFTNYRDVLEPYIPLIVLPSLLGILTRIPTYGDLLLKKTGDGTLLVLSVFVIVLIYWLWYRKRLGEDDGE